MERLSEYTTSCSYRHARTQTDYTSCIRASLQNDVKCQFESIGCDFRDTDLELHSKFLLMFCLKTDLRALKAHTELKYISSDFSHKIQQYIINLRSSQNESQGDNRMVTRLMEKIIAVKINLEEKNEHVNQRIVATEANMRLKDEQIAALHRQLEEISDSNEVIRFRFGILDDCVFEHLTRCCVRALSMLIIACQILYGRRRGMTKSDPFITPNCTKMKLKVFLNGEEVEAETCMTVYVVIVRGLDDENLNWPFIGKFILRVFDPKSSDYKFVANFDADPSHVSFQKPCTERNRVFDVDPSHFSFQKPCTERNIGYGFQRSIRHSELERLVKYDKLFIKVTIMTA
ncbi:hypothetical protein ACJMK2_036907 [Sinanodonta woodiana]|uniref:MATH domain-containing protein n=1 Tax=Sinanodonta woodiana TaxID=1069815 RepID=A0ABD3WJ02_SINWO